MEQEEYIMDINKSLDHFMRETGMTQAKLMRASGLDQSTISLIRNNHRTPSLHSVAMLAAAFEVPVSEFIRVGETHGKTTILRGDSRFRPIL